MFGPPGVRFPRTETDQGIPPSVRTIQSLTLTRDPSVTYNGPNMASIDTTDAAPQSGSAQKRVAGATGIMMATIMASRLLGLVRDRVIAHQFGQSFATDIYNAAFTIPDLLFFLIAGGALSSAFIPVFTDHIATGRERDAWKIFSVVTTVMTVVVGAFVVAGELLTPALVLLTNPGYVPTPAHAGGSGAFHEFCRVLWHVTLNPSALPAKAADTVPLTRILLPAQLCFFLGGLMMGTLNARGFFLIPAMGPVIYNAAIIVGGVVLSRFFGIAGLCWGALAGAVIGNLGLQWYFVKKTGGYFISDAWRKHRKHPGVRKVWILMLPVILGLALPQVSTIINKMFASALGDGPQSALMNANRLMQLPLGIFAQATAIAIFPTLSAQAARKEFGELRKTANFGIRSILFLTIPSSFLMVVLALPIVQLILHTGKFGPREAQDAATALIWYSVGIFAWSAHAIIARGFYALQDSRTPVIVGTIVTIIFIPMNWILMKWMSFGGLALATSIAATIHMTSMLFLLRKRLNGIGGGKLLVSVAKIVTASGCAAAICFGLRKVMERHFASFAEKAVAGHALITLAVCLTAGGIVYVALAMAMRMEEWTQVRGHLRSFTRRFSGARA